MLVQALTWGMLDFIEEEEERPGSTYPIYLLSLFIEIYMRTMGMMILVHILVSL